jgi:ribose/xylose/arabinose/galactoside ABC-type transport system permease subunit
MTAALPAVRPPRSRTWIAQLGLLFVVLAMLIALSAAGGNRFLNRGNLIEILGTSMSYYAIMAVGMTIVIVSGGIDISVGAIMALAAILTAWVLGRMEYQASAWAVLPVAIGLPILIGLVCGVINGALIVALRLHPFIVTLGTLSIFRGLVNVVPPAKTMPVMPNKVPFAFMDGLMRAKIFNAQAVPMIVMLVIVVIGYVYLRHLVPGRNTYAIGGNEEAARLSGIRVARLKLGCYAISGVCAGIAGMVLLGFYGRASATTGEGYELTVVAAAVVGGASLSGGRGTAIGALLGTLVIALIENGISILQWNQEYRRVIIGSAIIVAVSLDRLSEALGSRSR